MVNRLNFKEVAGSLYIFQASYIYLWYKNHTTVPGHVIRRLIRNHEHCLECGAEYDDYTLPTVCCCILDEQISNVEIS